MKWINRALLNFSNIDHIRTRRTFDHLYLFKSVIFCLIQMAIVESVCLFYFFHFAFAFLYKKGRENVLINNLIEAASEAVSKR